MTSLLNVAFWLVVIIGIGSIILGFFAYVLAILEGLSNLRKNRKE